MIVVDDEALICIDGPLDSGEAPGFHRAVDDARRLGVRRVVVDLGHVPTIDEAGAAALAAAAAALRGGLVLVMADGSVATVDDAASLRALLDAGRPDRG
jgi:anti-anti-sigma regulatory factor